MTDQGPHDAVVEAPEAEKASRRISAVWLVPLLALAISLGVAWRSYSERGPLIEITLDNAAGVEAGKTTLRFRDVTVGVVEDLRFTPDLRQVIATARIEKDMARYLDASAQFWVVRPSVTAQGVSGIETLVSGVYIEAYWSGEPGDRVSEFEALPRAPLTAADEPGRRIRLRATNGGSLAVGAPVLFKRIPVGQIENVELTDAGDVMVDLFIGTPHDAFLTEGARFWNASGFSIDIGTGGASLNVESLVSLLQGGIAFAQVGSQLDQVDDGHVFELYPSEAVARQNVIEDVPGARLTLNAFFDSTVSGLAPGAKVDFRGVTVGEVTAFQPVIQRDGGAQRLEMRVTLAVIPQRLGVPEDAADPDADGLDLIADLVASGGLRAQLASSGLLSQSLHVSLAELADVQPASLIRDADPYPVLPTAPSEITGIAASAENVMNRVSNLPIEELMETFTTLLANVNALVTEEGFRSAPANIGALIADVREVIETSGIKETPAQIAATLASIQTVVRQVETEELMTELTRTIETTRVTIEKFGVAAEGVPALVDRVSGLPLDDFVASATRTVDGIEALVRSDATAALPGSVEAALAEARGLITDMRTGGAIQNASASLASLRQLTDELQAANLGAEITNALAAAEGAIANIDDASQRLPALLDSLQALTDRVDELPLDTFLASATRTVDGVDALVRSDAATALPGSVDAALGEARGLIAELRAGGSVENLGATLASLRELAEELRAADLGTQVGATVANVDAATAGLPELIDNLRALSATVDQLPLDQLVASATGVLDSADTFLASNGLDQVPDELAQSLAQVRMLISELREGGAVENVNATLASADEAAAAITTAAGRLPALVAQLEAVSQRADTALATFAPGSELTRETQLLLRDLRTASQSVNALVNALERRPNSVLFGR